MFKMSLLIMTKGNKIYWKGVEQLKNDPSFVKNANNKWYHYNDTSISKVPNLNALKTPRAYCLFYRKKK